MQLLPTLVRSGLVNSIFQGRQMLSSGAVLVNRKEVRRASLFLKPGDLVTIDPSYSGSHTHGGKSVRFMQKPNVWKFPWLAFSQTKALSVVILRYPKASELTLSWSFNPQACFAF
jgi:ribosomal protein S4